MNAVGDAADVDVRGGFMVWSRGFLFVGVPAFVIAAVGLAAPIAWVGELLLVPLLVRVAAVRVWTDGDRLLVRNFWSTDEVSRSDVAAFNVADQVDMTARSMRQRVVYAATRDGRRIRCGATQRDYYKFWSFTPREGTMTRTDEFCAQLNAWLRDGAPG